MSLKSIFFIYQFDGYYNPHRFGDGVFGGGAVSVMVVFCCGDVLMVVVFW